MKDIVFYSTHGAISFDEVIRDIADFIVRDPRRFYKVIIGTDSRARSPVSLVTAITIWRVGNGAVHFWTKAPERIFHTLHDRIWQEAISSITMAQEIRSRLTEELGDHFFWDGNEIHVDIGEGGPTREFIDGVTGMIKGYNFTPVIKPYAFGASVVADRHT